MAFREKAGKFGMYLLCAAGGAAALFLLLRYLLPAFAPFIFSFILALILQKPVNFSRKNAACRVRFLPHCSCFSCSDCSAAG